jgi:hypothetical protein
MLRKINAVHQTQDQTKAGGTFQAVLEEADSQPLG